MRRFPVYLGDVYSFGGPGNPEAVPGDATLNGSYTLADWLEPIFLSDNSQGEVGELRCVADKHPEGLDTAVSAGQAIRVYDIGENGEDAGDPTAIFEGVIAKLHYVINGNSEQAELVAYHNADYLLYRICIHGQYRRTYAQEVDFFTGWPQPLENEISGVDQLYRIDTPCVFNPDGQYNMSEDTWAIDGISFEGSGVSSSSSGGSGPCEFVKGTHIFEVPGRYHYRPGEFDGDAPFLVQAKPWTLGKAVQYLLTTTAANWGVNPQSWSAADLTAIFCAHGDPVISNIDVEGKSLLQALRMLLEPYNYGFSISPIPSGTPPIHALEFFYRGSGDVAPVTLSARGTYAGASTANLISADFTRDFSPIINTVRSYGDQIIHTTLAHTDPPTPGMGQPPALKLVKGWKDADLEWKYDQNGKVNFYDTDFRKKYVNPVNLISKLDSGGGSFRYPYGVGRYWVVNLGEQPNATLMDLTPALNDNANGVNSIDPRRFEKPAIYDRNTAGGFLHQEEVQVEMSFDNGDHWAVVDENWYRLGSENMSVTFTEPHLERLGLKFINADFPAGTNYWQALKDGTLRIRVLCGVKSDERLSESNFNDGAAFPLAIERTYINQGYKKYKYNPLIDDSVYVTNYEPVKAGNDDREALGNVNEQHLKNTNRQMIGGELRCVMGDFRQFYPGQIVTGFGGRFSFSPAPTVLRVVYDFPNKHVRLILDNRFIKTVIDTKRTGDVTRREKTLGIDNPSPIQGNRVPFIPGDEDSWKRWLLNGREGSK